MGQNTALLIAEEMLHCEDELTHHGVGSDDGGRVAGDSIAAGAGVDASRVCPVHLAAVQGVVLRGEGQRLPLLGATNNPAQLRRDESNFTKNFTMAERKDRQSSPVYLGG